MIFRPLVTLLGVVALTSANLNITSPPITNWGPWGNFDRCPFGRKAQGFQLKTEPNQYLGDDTALNAIRLFCGDPFRPDTAVITSTQGDYGNWGNVYNCYPGVLSGFQLRSESNRGSGDDTAANNIRFFCTGLPDPNEYIEGDGMSWGDWTEAQRCYFGQAICAIQTQVEPYLDSGDDTMLNNVRMECCDFQASELETDYERTKQMGTYPQAVNPKFAHFMREAVKESLDKPNQQNEEKTSSNTHLPIVVKAVVKALQVQHEVKESKTATQPVDFNSLMKTVTEALKRQATQESKKSKADFTTLSKAIIEALKSQAILDKNNKSEADFTTLSNAIIEALKSQALLHKNNKPKASFPVLVEAIVQALKKQEMENREKPKPSLEMLANSVAKALNKKTLADH